MKHDCENFHIYRCWFQRFFCEMFYPGWVFGDGAYLAVNPILNFIKVLNLNTPSIRPDLISQGVAGGPFGLPRFDRSSGLCTTKHPPTNPCDKKTPVNEVKSIVHMDVVNWSSAIKLMVCPREKISSDLGGGHVPHRKFIADFLETKKKVHVEVWMVGFWMMFWNFHSDTIHGTGIIYLHLYHQKQTHVGLIYVYHTWILWDWVILG